MYTGKLLGNRIMVWNIEEAQNLYKIGFFGKPIGIHKPKSSGFSVPLVLDVIEALYLVEKKLLKVLSTDGTEISFNQLFKICQRDYRNFDSKYNVYKNLRDKGHVVLPGIKFGCDFAVYEHGPGIDHAPYLVQVVEENDKLSATYVVLSGRLATTVRKKFIIAIVEKEKPPKYLAFEWWKA